MDFVLLWVTFSTDTSSSNFIIVSSLFSYCSEGHVNEQHFVQNPNLTSLVADLTTSQNILSENWKNKHQINTKIESDRLKQAAEESVFIFKQIK